MVRIGIILRITMRIIVLVTILSSAVLSSIQVVSAIYDPHYTHLASISGPQVQCLDCHNPRAIPMFKDMKTLNDTIVCDTCHSPGGIYDGVNDSFIGAKPNWKTGVYDDNSNLKIGKEKWCLGCHDNSPSIVKGEIAPNKTGDENTYGYYITGHGRTSNYDRMSWQSDQDIGNPGANKSCGACHDVTSRHIVIGSGITGDRLRPGYENDQNNTNCNNCHIPPGSPPKFYIDSESYERSAHGGKNCTDCHDVHGSGNGKAMTRENKQNLCYGCHKDPNSDGIRNDALSNNRPGGYKSSDDIQEAFSKVEKHDLGTTFNIDNKNYILECVSCHNIHLVTGKYWDASYGKSPVTRFNNNTYLWGDNSGEKMNDFASKSSGSGGWYYSVARGRIVQFDQRAVYQPPLSGSGYNFEFGGDILPDYATFCLDCHTYRMSDANPPINWGQGIPCTGNSVDPPDQRVECGAQHGLGSANKPSYTTDLMLYGSGGNPDPIFNVSGVTRGRGVGHFMRWPYETAQRIAGINFVMSCTDCHEAHGSGISSMIRERFNVNDQGACGTGNNGQNCGTTTWNNYYNTCHYYYGGQHTGMSCSTASCHEAQSIHRIIHNTESGGTYLWAEPGRPSNTPEIENVFGTIGSIDSNELTVIFSQGVYTDNNNTGSLKPEDFVLVDTNSDNPKIITDVIHSPGSSTAKIIMNNPLIETDILNDSLATAGISIWNGTPAGPWPVKISMKSVIFQLNEPAGSTMATDESGKFKGRVNSPSGSFIGDGYFHGNGSNNYIDFENYDTSFKVSTGLTLEIRIKPVGLEGTGTYIRRIFARDYSQNYQISVWRNNSLYPNYSAPSGTASIAFWVSPIDKHGGAAWKPVLTDYNTHPIISDHFYKVKVIWNSSKIGGIPAGIFVDDEGTDGNGLGENWQGYTDATDSDQSLIPADRRLYEGDKITMSDGDFVIGSNVNNHNNNAFNGLIDWIKWQGVPDYT